VARVMSGETTGLALQTVVAGESNPLVRSSMAVATPLKWAAAFLAGPPQAVVSLSNFQGLPLLLRDVRSAGTRGPAAADMARLMAGFILVWMAVYAAVRTRDWRLIVAMLAVVALPVIRNGQYTYNKFYVLWPALMALASTKFPARWVLTAGMIVFVLNGVLLARDLQAGRRLRTETTALYRAVQPDTCFFTTGWSAPFSYIWPGTTTAIISDLWRTPDFPAAAHPLTSSLRRCFCESPSVWTDSTQRERESAGNLLQQFSYNPDPVLDLLYRPGDGTQIAADPKAIFVYSAARQAEFCRRITNR
jgi:hypothetical protein